MTKLGTVSAETRAKLFGQPWDGQKAFDGQFKYERATDPIDLTKKRRDS